MQHCLIRSKIIFNFLKLVHVFREVIWQSQYCKKPRIKSFPVLFIL